MMKMNYIKSVYDFMKGVSLMKYCSHEDKIRFSRIRKKRTRKKNKRKYIRILHLLNNRMQSEKKQIVEKRLSEGTIKSIVAPSVFNLMKNTDEMLTFFSSVEKQLKDLLPIKIVMKDVIELSVDGLLYLIAIIQNARTRGCIFHIEGDLPTNLFCRKTLQSSGFFKYVRSKTQSLQVIDDSVLRITSNFKHDPKDIKSLCDFVIDKFNCSRKNTKYLYNTLTELIQNTIGHAYLKTSPKDSWFFFARYNEDGPFIDIAFLDTGHGIPTTVRKNFWEIIKECIKSTDSELIFSALNGDFRTKTRLRTRGKGLPSIYNRYKEGEFQNFFVLSNFGIVFNGEQRELPHKFEGTLFSWRIQKCVRTKS